MIFKNTEKDRYRGCLLGLAVGDALGTTLEFSKPGTFEPISDMVGGGPFRLKAGEWTDDTSMALCLAQSLLLKKQFDPYDQMDRYLEWWEVGYNSATGDCFDIGNTVSGALAKYKLVNDTNAYCGSTDTWSAGNGSIMRLAPVPLFFKNSSPDVLMENCVNSSRTTHAHEECLVACQLMGVLIAEALDGAAKESLLDFNHLENKYGFQLSIDRFLKQEFKSLSPPDIRGTGYVVDSLEAALWAFYRSDNFKEGALMAVNLGDDADTTGAVYGQIAGAYYGKSGIPKEWLSKLAWSEKIQRLSDQLLDISKER